MDALKAQSEALVTYFQDYSQAILKETDEAKTKAKIRAVVDWAKAELVKTPKPAQPEAGKVYMNDFMSKHVASYQKLTDFLDKAIDKNYFTKAHLTEGEASVKANGQNCLTAWELYNRRNLCLSCSPRGQTFYVEASQKIFESALSELLQNGCGPYWFNVFTLALPARALAYLMTAQANKDLPADYFAMKQDLEFSNAIEAMEKLSKLTKENFSGQYNAFKTTNGPTHFVNSLLSFDKARFIYAWGHQKDFELAGAIFNAAAPTPAPAPKRLLNSVIQTAHRILQTKATGALVFSENDATVDFPKLDGFPTAVDVKVDFNKASVKRANGAILSVLAASFVGLVSLFMN